MSTETVEKLFTAIGIFQAGNLQINVAVPNFSSLEEAQAYAQAFRIKLANGRLLRDDGLGTGVFDESSREVLDSQLSLTRLPGTDGGQPDPLPIAQWHLEPGLNGDFSPVAWRVEESKI